MAKIPAKAKKIDNKTIPFEKPNKKFSNVKLLPEVLQTDNNKQIISTTLDNLTSKGSLEQINGYVGKKQGGYYDPSQDRYLEDNDLRNKYQFSGSPVSYDEENIYSTLYEIHYYEKAARDSLRGFTYGSDTDWLTIKEGDTTIQRQNKNSVAKTFRDLKVDATDRLNDVVGKYNTYKSYFNPKKYIN